MHYLILESYLPADIFELLAAVLSQFLCFIFSQLLYLDYEEP